MVYVEMDMYKKSLYGCHGARMNNEGESVDGSAFTNSRRGIEEFVTRLEAFRDAHIVWFMLRKSEAYRGERRGLSRRRAERLPQFILRCQNH